MSDSLSFIQYVEGLLETLEKSIIGIQLRIEITILRLYGVMKNISLV